MDELLMKIIEISCMLLCIVFVMDEDFILFYVLYCPGFYSYGQKSPIVKVPLKKKIMSPKS